jgi:hypothetical protein
VIYKTLEGVLHPDGKLTLPPTELSDHPVRVLVTILASVQETGLPETGDYLERLTEYEEGLARGRIVWQ